MSQVGWGSGMEDRYSPFDMGDDDEHDDDDGE